MAKQEATVYGVAACLAVGQHRPDSILRVFYDAERRMIVKPLLEVAVARRRPYREVQPEELERLAGGLHHEGVVVITQPLWLYEEEALFADLRPSDVFLALDTIGNPHNLGAILRSAAWFGAAAVIFPVTPEQATLSAAAVRVAHGGAEVVPCIGVHDLAPVLERLRLAGFTVLGADQRAKPVDFSKPFPRPLCLVLGNESTGLSEPVKQALTDRIAIPGTAAVESLNVSVSAGVLLAAALSPRG